MNLREAAPGLTVSDLEKSLAWYRDVLGFVVTERWEQDGKLLGVEITAGSVLFMLGQDDWQKGRDRVMGAGVRIYCSTDEDIDQLAAGIRARGGTLTQEPKDQSWGMRDFALEDPDGYKITIGQEKKK
ncbi:MAG: VOC family protein [Acidobacteriota bacterium]